MKIQDILAKLDNFFRQDDPEGAHQYLKEQIAQAEEAGEWENELTLQNELIGYCRKKGHISEGKEAIQRAAAILEQHHLQRQVPAATTWLNAATALRAFGEKESALHYFEMTKEIYSGQINDYDYRYAGLYNNMGLLLCDMKRFEEAEAYFHRALQILQTDPQAGAEMASTYVSLAHMYRKRNGESESAGQVEEALKEAKRLLDVPGGLPDSYFAYMCQVCASSYRLLGYEEDAQDLERLAEQFYKGQRSQ